MPSTSNEDIFGPVHSAEEGLVEDVARFLESLPPAGRVYASQLSSLFNDDAHLEASVLAQIAHTGGERLWQKVKNRS